MISWYNEESDKETKDIFGLVSILLSMDPLRVNIMREVEALIQFIGLVENFSDSI
jgi:hypothetical protein